MSVTRRTILAGGAALAAASFPGASVFAAGYPSRPVRVICPWAPGASADALTRLIAERLSTTLSGQFFVENVAGATGTLGHAAVAHAQPDGENLVVGSNSTYAIVPHLMSEIPYKQTDLAPIGLVARNPQVLCIHPSVPATTLAEFVTYAKANPGELIYGSGGQGGTSHLASAMFVSMAGLDSTHVPYRGGGAAQQALMAGEVQFAFLDVANGIPLAASGAVRALGTSATYRPQVAADVPTIAESGYPEFESGTVFALFATAGTPADIQQQLNVALNAILTDAEVMERMQKLGLDPIGGTPEELTAHIEAESAKWGGVIAAHGIKLE